MDPDSRDCECTLHSYQLCAYTLSVSLLLSLSLSLSLHMRAHTHTHTHTTHTTLHSHCSVVCMYLLHIYSCLPLLQIINVVFFVDLLCSPSVYAFVCTYLWCIVLQESRSPLMAAAQKNRNAAIQILEAIVTGMLPLKWYVYLCARSKPASCIIGIMIRYIFSQQDRDTAVMFRSSEVWPSSICKNFIYYRNTTANQSRM